PPRVRINFGHGRQSVPRGRPLVGVPPLEGEGSIIGMFWSAKSKTEMTVTGGFFIGPMSPTDDTARFGSFDRPTSILLAQVADTGTVPTITDADRRQAIVDLKYWRGAGGVRRRARQGGAAPPPRWRRLGP